MNLKQSDTLIVIPTYNEKHNIRSIISNILNLKKNFHILVVDDNSPDGTANLVDDLILDNTGLFIIKRASKLGIGSAYAAGFKFAIQKSYKYVAQLDADLSHDVADLERIVNECISGNWAMVVGSRYINGVRVLNWPIDRILLSYFANFFIRLITRINIYDVTSGFNCIRVNALAKIGLDNLKSNNYEFQAELKFKIWLLNLKIKEFPIIFKNREHGNSKLTKVIVLKAFFNVIIMKLKSFF